MKKADIKTILVPIDFSRLSAPAIRVAKDMARRFGATIHLAHVHEFFYPPDLLSPVPIPLTNFRDDAAIRRLGRLKFLGRQNGLLAANCHFMTGAPTFYEVCNLARQISADLIVMSTHGYTGMAHMLAGSTAERIVQHSPCPVLVVRGKAKKTSPATVSRAPLRAIDSILVPVDFSQTSFQALEYAIEFAEKVAARLIVFHAIALSDSFTAEGYGRYNLEALEEAARVVSEEQMQKFIGLAKFRRVSFETVVAVAPTVLEVCTLAKMRDVDLIITATHGRTGLKHLLMGSIAEHVVRQAPRSVLVVPSHPEVRSNRLTKKAPSAAQLRIPRSDDGIRPDRGDKLTRKNRKLFAHPSPERRKTNRFRESHAV
jgi:nucleotide-binding universal stress UspA family protein